MAKPLIYWIDHEGPGRLAILARPQGGETLLGNVQGWRDAGIDAVVSLLTESDNEYLGLSAEGELCRSVGLQFISFPIPDCGVPASFERGLAGEAAQRITGRQQEYWIPLSRLHWTRAIDCFLRLDVCGQERRAGFRPGERRSWLFDSRSAGAI